MTRINIVPTEELSDQHLVAEYREIFMVGSALARTLKSPNKDKSLSCLLYTSPSPRDATLSRMPSSA